MRIEFSPPDITEAEIQSVVDALRSGWITTGPRTKRFEQELATWCQTSKVVCLNSATAALECALRLLGVGPGDEVITSAYTYTASCSVICHVGATPVLVDIQSDSFEMNYNALTQAITPRTKVIIPVDIAGIMCDYDVIREKIEQVKDRFSPKPGTLQEAFDRVIVLADAAHSFGATYKGQPSGAVADFTAFSFHAVKNLTTAEGGALTWRAREGLDNATLYKQLMLLSLHGQDKDALAKNKPGSWEYDIVAPLYKCNMTDIAAALGMAQLEGYHKRLARRQDILERYASKLASEDIEFPAHYTERGSSSGHLCIVRLLGRGQAFRNLFIEKMAEHEVSCNVHYKPLPMLTAYRKLGFVLADYPRAYLHYENEVTLPLHTLLTNEDVDYVVDAFKASYRECVGAGV
jgi:dTDP-4-amino-4,6-dideoxygalactose transaminase